MDDIRLARALVTLRDQVNALAPERSKASDGWIGDAAHRARKSDHNPDANGIVHAIDITNDPANGMDSHKLALALIESRDGRIKNIIDHGHITAGNGGPSPWVTRPYDGSNPHNHHVHISVTAADGDDPLLWHFTMDHMPSRPILRKGDSGPHVRRLQDMLHIQPEFGPATEKAVLAFQKKAGLTADGIVGPKTWEALEK